MLETNINFSCVSHSYYAENTWRFRFRHLTKGKCQGVWTLLLLYKHYSIIQGISIIGSRIKSHDYCLSSDPFVNAWVFFQISHDTLVLHKRLISSVSLHLIIRHTQSKCMHTRMYFFVWRKIKQRVSCLPRCSNSIVDIGIPWKTSTSNHLMTLSSCCSCRSSINFSRCKYKLRSRVLYLKKPVNKRKI